MPPSTFGGVIEWAAALILAVYAAMLLYRACTYRGYVVRCSSCGAAHSSMVERTEAARRYR